MEVAAGSARGIIFPGSAHTHMAGRISPIRAKARDPSVVEARASPGGPILAREAISSIGSGREKIPVPPISQGMPMHPARALPRVLKAHRN